MPELLSREEFEALPPGMAKDIQLLMLNPELETFFPTKIAVSIGLAMKPPGHYRVLQFRLDYAGQCTKAEKLRQLGYPVKDPPKPKPYFTVRGPNGKPIKVMRAGAGGN